MPAHPTFAPLSIALSVAVAVVAAVVIAEVLAALARGVGRRTAAFATLARRGRTPLRVTLVLAAALGTLEGVSRGEGWRPAALHALALALIAATGWLAAVLTSVVEEAALSRFRLDVADNLRARRARTQILIVQRVTVALIASLCIGAMLMTFPAARAAGTSLVASAGIVGVIAGLAAQTSLGNVFAGIQIALTSSLRVDDVVVVQGEWGRIEDITLTYVVVHIWDDRRMILPSSYFTSQPFENWTRTSSQLLGTVELDVDWQIPVPAARAHLKDILAGTDLWDGRVAVLQVTEAIGPFVRLRILVSAKDSPTSWDLRCLVREAFVGWLQTEHPEALPSLHTVASTSGPSRTTTRIEDSAGDGLVFGGSRDGARRAEAFAGPGVQQHVHAHAHEPPGPARE